MAEIDVHENREDGGYQVLSYSARGHHDPTAFIGALEHGWWRTCSPDDVRHDYWRVVPCGEDGGLVACPALPGTRGAFRVTVVDAGDTREHQPRRQEGGA